MTSETHSKSNSLTLYQKLTLALAAILGASTIAWQIYSYNSPKSDERDGNARITAPQSASEGEGRQPIVIQGNGNTVVKDSKLEGSTIEK